MQFIWTDTEDTELFERELWRALKLALLDDEGMGYHRFPIFSPDMSRREPDFLLLHREWGLYIIKCLGCEIENIKSIDGSIWKMVDWISSQETPISEAEDQMWGILGKFLNERRLRKN